MPLNRPRSATVVDLPGDNSSSTIIPSEAYENGRAEAIGVLCRIFCSKKTDEDILPTYLSRFFIVLQHALRVKELRLSTLVTDYYNWHDFKIFYTAYNNRLLQDKYINESVASVLLYSADLLRVDLDGVYTLLPSIIDALETVLTNKDMRVRWATIPKGITRNSPQNSPRPPPFPMRDQSYQDGFKCFSSKSFVFLEDNLLINSLFSIKLIGCFFVLF